MPGPGRPFRPFTAHSSWLYNSSPTVCSRPSKRSFLGGTWGDGPKWRYGQEVRDPLPGLQPTLIDITKLPPPQFGPIGLSGWQDYLVRPDVLAILQTEYLSQLSRAQLADRKFAGGIDMSTGREWPDWTTSEWVDFHTYKELQRAANQAQWAREQAQLRAARPTPS